MSVLEVRRTSCQQKQVWTRCDQIQMCKTEEFVARLTFEIYVARDANPLKMQPYVLSVLVPIFLPSTIVVPFIPPRLFLSKHRETRGKFRQLHLIKLCVCVCVLKEGRGGEASFPEMRIKNRICLSRTPNVGN